MSLAHRIAAKLGLDADADTMAGFTEAFDAAFAEVRRELDGLHAFPGERVQDYTPELLLLHLWAEVRAGNIERIAAVSLSPQGRYRTWWTTSDAPDVIAAAGVLHVEGMNSLLDEAEDE